MLWYDPGIGLKSLAEHFGILCRYHIKRDAGRLITLHCTPVCDGMRRHSYHTSRYVPRLLQNFIWFGNFHLFLHSNLYLNLDFVLQQFLQNWSEIKIKKSNLRCSIWVAYCGYFTAKLKNACFSNYINKSCSANGSPAKATLMSDHSLTHTDILT